MRAYLAPQVQIEDHAPLPGRLLGFGIDADPGLAPFALDDRRTASARPERSARTALDWTASRDRQRPPCVDGDRPR